LCAAKEEELQHPSRSHPVVASRGAEEEQGGGGAPVAEEEAATVAVGKWRWSPARLPGGHVATDLHLRSPGKEEEA
jgi:hypothetical protein